MRLYLLLRMDLTAIEGIGPKISGLMKESGVSTFAAMADTSVERLQEILQTADFRALADPTTWPEQAKLAAKGDWEGLQTLQDELDGRTPRIIVFKPTTPARCKPRAFLV